MSLNVMITNSVRINYERELERAIAVDKFWQTDIAKEIQRITHSLVQLLILHFLCLLDSNGKLIEESALLFRHNPLWNLVIMLAA